MPPAVLPQLLGTEVRVLDNDDVATSRHRFDHAATTRGVRGARVRDAHCATRRALGVRLVVSRSRSRCAEVGPHAILLRGGK